MASKKAMADALKGGLKRDLGRSDTLVDMAQRADDHLDQHQAETLPAPRLIRTAVGIPQADYDLIEAIRKSCMTAGVAPSKAAVHRMALRALSQLTPAEQAALYHELEILKPGRAPSRMK